MEHSSERNGTIAQIVEGSAALSLFAACEYHRYVVWLLMFQCRMFLKYNNKHISILLCYFLTSSDSTAITKERKKL